MKNKVHSNIEVVECPTIKTKKFAYISKKNKWRRVTTTSEKQVPSVSYLMKKVKNNRRQQPWLVEIVKTALQRRTSRNYEKENQFFLERNSSPITKCFNWLWKPRNTPSIAKLRWSPFGWRRVLKVPFFFLYYSSLQLGSAIVSISSKTIQCFLDLGWKSVILTEKAIPRNDPSFAGTSPESSELLV